MWETYVIAFNVGERQLFRQVLCNRTLAASSRAGNDPHMAVMGRIEGAVDLLGGTGWGELHWWRGGQVVICINGEHVLIMNEEMMGTQVSCQG